jgi:hypothetical protein
MSAFPYIIFYRIPILGSPIPKVVGLIRRKFNKFIEEDECRLLTMSGHKQD